MKLLQQQRDLHKHIPCALFAFLPILLQKHQLRSRKRTLHRLTVLLDNTSHKPPVLLSDQGHLSRLLSLVKSVLPG